MGKEKKEIWKLLELLNEYGTQEEIKWKWYFVPNHIQWEGCDNSECSDLLIVSKKFWFIKWLVENDKINFSKVKEKIWLDRELYDRMLYWYKEDDFLIMILSVENEPIKFLCEILK